MLVLCYHKIGSIEDDWNGITITPDAFRQQLIWLKENYTIRNIGECSSGLSERDVIITFDDGYEDSFTTALPVLEELEIPVAFFISTGCLDTDKEDWCNELSWILRGAQLYPSRFDYAQWHFETQSVDQRVQLHRKLEREMMTFSNPERQILMEVLRDWSNVDAGIKRRNYRMLSKAQLQALAASQSVTIGAHTVNHPALGALSQEEQCYEILESRKTLQNMIGTSVDYFAYPFGGPDSYTRTTIQILKYANFRNAFSTTYKRKETEDFSYEIPRVCINECNLEGFIRKIQYYQSKKSYLHI